MAVCRGAFVLALSAFLLSGGFALAQGNYEAQFGEPITVDIDDLIQDPAQYNQRSVRTSGRLDLSQVTGGVGGAR